jgi:hypothetical protein
MSETDLVLATEELDVSQCRLKFLGIATEIPPIGCFLEPSISLKEILDSKIAAFVFLIAIHGKAMHRIPSGDCQCRSDKERQ